MRKPLHIVDYKSTSQTNPDQTINLEGPYKAAYKRQMDLYVWVLRRMGFDVSGLGYFLYVDGARFAEADFIQGSNALMEFKCSLIRYETNQTWIDGTLAQIKKVLNETERPQHAKNCEFGMFLANVSGA